MPERPPLIRGEAVARREAFQIFGIHADLPEFRIESPFPFKHLPRLIILPIQKSSFRLIRKEVAEENVGPDHPDVSTSLNNLSLLYRATNRSYEAAKLEARAARIFSMPR